mgnify:CR=1 FL=1
MPATLIHLPRGHRPDHCEAREPRALHRFDPGPPIPWPVAPLVALGMAIAMLPWLPAAYLMHINRPE